MESRLRLVFLVAIVTAALLAPAVLAGQPPAIYSVAEGTDPGTGRPTLTISGKALSKFVNFGLSDGDGPVGNPDVLSRKSSLLVLRLPAELEPGSYTLSLDERSGEVVDLPVKVSNGRALPASIDGGALSPALHADLDDAATLNGQPGTYYKNAGNLTGTLGTGLFSAFADLEAEGKLGTGADQVARGDHDHDFSDRYAAIDHGHGPGGLGVLGVLGSPLTASASTVSDPNNQGDTWYAKSRLSVLSVEVSASELSKVVVVLLDWRFLPKFDEGKEERSITPTLMGAFIEVDGDQYELPRLQVYESVLKEQQKYLDVLGMTKPAEFQYSVNSHILVLRPTASQLEDGFTLDLFLSVAAVDANDTTGFDVVVDRAVVVGQ